MTGTDITPSANVAGKNGFSLISDRKFKELYANLLQCCLLDRQLQKKKTYEQWAGREAGTAAVVACLSSGDTIVPTQRGTLASHLHHRRFTHDTTSDAITELIAGTAEALRHRLQKQNSIAVVFTSSSNFTRKWDQVKEAFAVAARNSLPVLYLLEGNAPLADASSTIPVIRTDALDTVAVYRVAYEATLRARDGGGPTIIDCAVWPGQEKADPLQKLEQYLSAKKLFRPAWKQHLEQKYTASIRQAAK